MLFSRNCFDIAIITDLFVYISYSERSLLQILFFLQTMSKAMDVPSNSNYTGDCGKTEQNLTLSWKSHNNSNSQNNFTLHFVKNETDKHYSLHHLEISLAPQEFPNNTTSMMKFFIFCKLCRTLRYRLICFLFSFNPL